MYANIIYKLTLKEHEETIIEKIFDNCLWYCCCDNENCYLSKLFCCKFYNDD